MSFWSDVLGVLSLAADEPGQDAANVSLSIANGASGVLDQTATDLTKGILVGVEGVLSDLWTVIQGPIMIGLGIGLFILAMAILFQGQILQVAPLIAAMG